MTLCKLGLKPLIEEEGNRANTEEYKMTTTERDDLETIPSGVQPSVTQPSVVAVIPASISNVVRNSLPQVSEVTDDASENKNFRDEESQIKKVGRDSLLEKVNNQTIEKETFQKHLL